VPSVAQFTAKTIQPTPEQRAIQTSDAQTLIVLANAGAAKTTSLALRMAEGLARGLPPKSMLALTYTEPACDALRLALIKIGVPALEVKGLWISTFERFARYCLKAKEGVEPSHFDQPERVEDTVWEAIRVLDEVSLWPDQLHLPVVGDTGFVERFLQSSLRIKGTLAREGVFENGDSITPDMAVDLGHDFTYLSLLGTYERLRCPPEDDAPRFRAPLDATYDLARFVSDPDQPDWIDLFPNWPRQLNALLVDEMHDLNATMFAVLKALLVVNPRCYVCGVGDVDQVLYANAGADACYLDARNWVQETGRRVTQLPLSASYRFHAEVADLAGHFANKPYASHAAHHTLVTTLTYTHDEECAQAVVQVAQHWHAAKRKMNDLIVLLRHPHQSVLIENALLAADMPYTTRGMGLYVQRPEVLLVRAILAIALRDFAAVQSASTRRRMVEELVSFCRVSLSFSMDEQESEQDRLKEAVRHVVLDPSALTPFFEGQILRNTDPKLAKRLKQAVAIAQEADSPDSFGRMLDALDMPNWAATHWVEAQRRADAVAHLKGLHIAATRVGSAQAFFAELNRAELGLEALQAKGGKTAKASALCLADIASVKGLEFEHVVMPFLAQDEFPSRERISMADERNLFYVGLTRARSALTLVASSVKPSPFLGEL
jgi:DNA helicase-2/ATP-dependent DNA helicase PcrA